MAATMRESAVFWASETHDLQTRWHVASSFALRNWNQWILTSTGIHVLDDMAATASMPRGPRGSEWSFDRPVARALGRGEKDNKVQPEAQHGSDETTPRRRDMP